MGPLIAFTAGLAAMSATATCGMEKAFAAPDRDGTITIDVWQDKEGKALLFAEVLNVNTDGTKRSYSVDDFWGQTRALNNLCNAMSDACAGLNKDGLRARRLATQQAKADGWPAGALAATRISPSIIPFKNGKPCPEVDGYLVSATALHKPKIDDACRLDNYVDALSVPAIVIPKRAKKGVPTPWETRGASVGDLVVVVSGDGARTIFAVIGDQGPSNELGEGSIALNGALLGRTAPPKTYNEAKTWTAKGTVLIFPRTKDATSPYMTPDRISAEAQKRFQAWGGAARLEACRVAYRPK